MIEVIDLGLNVPAERFVEEAIAHHDDASDP
jgi:methanogenic corrinoid protein MtbC1